MRSSDRSEPASFHNMPLPLQYQKSYLRRYRSRHHTLLFSRFLGCPQTADGILEDYLVKDGRTNTSRICTEETPGAKVARLSYHIAKTTAEFSLAEIHLDTGRHHQIRVQMAHLGCPIAGDRKYGPNQTSFSQLQLFACRLEFAHPKTKKHMEFTHAPVLRVFADETPADHPVG